MVSRWHISIPQPTGPKTVGAVSGGTRLVPALAARVRLVFDDSAADLRHEAEWESIVAPLGTRMSMETTSRTLTTTNVTSVQVPQITSAMCCRSAKIHTKGFFSAVQSTLKDHIYRSEQVELFRNKELKLFSRIDETEEDFAARCAGVAEDGADADADKLRQAMVNKEDRLRVAIGKTEDRLRELESDCIGPQTKRGSLWRPRSG